MGCCGLRRGVIHLLRRGLLWLCRLLRLSSSLLCCRLLCCLRLLWLLGWTLCLQGIAAFWADGLAAGQWVAALQAS